MSDVVVVLPGIMGSTLAAADGTPLWAPSAGAALRAIGTFGRSVTRYTPPPDLGDAHPDDGVRPLSLMPDLHVLPGIWTPIRGYDCLVERLHRLGFREPTPERPGNLLLVPYDWRLSNRYTARYVQTRIEPALQRWRDQGGPCADARLIFVCHSMGGLVARWYLEHCDGWKLTRKLITLGTPYRGAAHALLPLINGVPLPGQIGTRFTQFARRLPALHQLIPEYACIEHHGDYRTTTETEIPEIATTVLADAMRFHTQLRDAESARPGSVEMTHAIVGARQPTITTIRVDNDHAIGSDLIAGDNDYGDGTVPLAGALGYGLSQDSNRIRHIVDKHGNLHRNRVALDQVEEVITAQPIRRKATTPIAVRVNTPHLVLAGESVPVTVELDEDARHAVRIALTNENGTLLMARTPPVSRGRAHCTLQDLPPGAHTITVSGVTEPSPLACVQDTVLVWDQSDD